MSAMTTRKTTKDQDWQGDNQKYLASCINEIKLLLSRYVEKIIVDTSSITNSSNGSNTNMNNRTNINTQQDDLKKPSTPNLAPPPAIETICNLFSLSAFERSVLILCAGIELDAQVSELCARAQRNPNAHYPTFSLAFALLPDAHWSALTPVSPLRRFRLIELINPASAMTTTTTAATATLVTSPIRIEERILHFLTGISYLEPQLRGFVKPVIESSHVVESHERMTTQIIAACRNAGDGGMPVIIQLYGIDESSKRLVAKTVCSALGLNLWHIHSDLLPTKADELVSFIHLWSREAALLVSGLYISSSSAEDSDAYNSTDDSNNIRKMIKRFTEDIPGPVFLDVRERWSVPNSIAFEVKKPTKIEQRQLWRSCLKKSSSSLLDNDDNENNDDIAVESVISKVVAQFDLNASTILAANRERERGEEEQELSQNSKKDYYITLWNACRAVTRPRLGELAERIIPKATMDGLVLPVREKALLQQIAIHVAQRTKVYDEWGFSSSTNRGLGITALFAGSSGTGKTMAAEVLANQLTLDLFRIDISTVVSKYIGETEKNLRKIFDAAEEGGAILFFDEADALFGKRTEVKDSHDRYANIEINYLLQRIESYRGLAILATNMKSAMDPAFVRRIRFIVNFPFPNEKSRVEIWRRIFPSSTPLDSSVDYRKLARMDIPGGNIRNVAMNAAFLAADEDVPVNIKHLRRAAEMEYAKIERPFTNELP